jgi:hypothetical protein
MFHVHIFQLRQLSKTQSAKNDGKRVRSIKIIETGIAPNGVWQAHQVSLN